MIADKIGEDLILGIDFLQQNSCVIDVANKTLKFKTVKRQLTKLISVNVTENQVIKPKQTQLISVQIAQIKSKVNFQHLLIRGTSFINKKGIFVTEAILPIGCIETLKLRVTNATNSEIKLNENDKIANCTKINDNWQIKDLDPTEQAFINSIEIYNYEQPRTEKTIINQKRDWKTEFQMDKMEVNESDKIKLCQLFDEFESTCSKGDMDLGRTTIIEHEINTGNNYPIRQPLRRITPAQRPIVEQKIAEMLAQGVIVKSASPWCSPIVLVPKKGTEDINDSKAWRFCVDYRETEGVRLLKGSL